MCDESLCHCVSLDASHPFDASRDDNVCFRFLGSRGVGVNFIKMIFLDVGEVDENNDACEIKVGYIQFAKELD